MCILAVPSARFPKIRSPKTCTWLTLIRSSGHCLSGIFSIRSTPITLFKFQSPIPRPANTPLSSFFNFFLIIWQLPNYFLIYYIVSSLPSTAKGSTMTEITVFFCLYVYSKTSGILIGITLNVGINSGGILTVSCLPVCDYGLSLHLFITPLLSLRNVVDIMNYWLCSSVLPYCCS